MRQQKVKWSGRLPSTESEYREFIELWQGAESRQALVEATGLKAKQVSRLASDLRGKGIKLKSLNQAPRFSESQLRSLAAFAAELASDNDEKR